MIWTLKDTAKYIQTSRAPKGLVAVIQTVRHIFTFTSERSNRLARFVKIVAIYKIGKPIRDIETQYGCSKNTILRYARMAGLPKRDRGFDPGIRERTIALYLAKKPIAEIAMLLGVSQAYVSKTATEEGLNRRKFKPRQKKESGNARPSYRPE